MGIGQTSYSQKMGPGFPGMAADNGDYSCEAFILDVAAGFGLGVVAGALSAAQTASGGSVKLPTAQGDVFRGITAHKHKEHGYHDSNVAVTYAANEIADIIRKGRRWVQTDGTCTIDGTVYVTTDGKFTSTAGSNATATTGVFRRIESTLSMAILEINLP